MTLSSEEEVKRALEIDTWRNLSREKVLRFAAMMPDMDREVALRIVQQLPVFTRFALDALGVIERAHQATLNSNRDSQDKVHEALKDYRDVLKGELAHDSLSVDERQRIREALKDAVDKEYEKDSENKRFIDGLFTKAAAGAGMAVLAAIVFVGGKVALQAGEDKQEADT